MKTLKEIKELYNSVFYLEEDMILDVVLATTIATKLPGDPIWLLVIGGPSSGKSELVNSLNKVPFVFPISSLTENTFLSNMRISDGKEASLLHEIGASGMITMKDYTSILAMRAEKREVIVSQMREIYDGALTKRSGNGKSEEWEGKINWIGAVTESIYLKEDESAGMGRRTINFIMPLQDRRKTTERALANNSDIGEKRTAIQDAFAEFVMEHMNNLPDELPQLSDEFNEQLIDLADFITLVRTPTERNFRGELVLVPAPEMPMRVFQMFQSLARVILHMHMVDNPLLDIENDMQNIMKILNRLAFDSIPKQRKLVLDLLAKYSKITTKGTAQELRYPTETMRVWLENVNVLGICERKSDGSGPDCWIMNKHHKDMMIKYGGIVPFEKVLSDRTELVADDIQPAWMTGSPKLAQAVGGKSDDPGVIAEEKRQVQEAFDNW